MAALSCTVILGLVLMTSLNLSNGLEKKRCDRVCTTLYKPVCGTNGVTYGNICLLGVASCKNPTIRKAYDGRCRDQNEPCYGLTDPLKNSKGKQLCCGRCAFRDVCPRGSFCHIHPADRFSVCCPNSVKPKPRCERRCTKIYRPVCGSDGKTYGNRCVFEVARCKNPRLRFRHNGPCRVCPKFCTKIYRPVCGSDGKTYGNECMFKAAQCKNPRLRLRYKRACTACLRICTKIYRPVCGSDGKTYGNECMFKVAQCKNPRLRLRYRRACTDRCPKFCTEQYDPVCGTNGKTYGNLCMLRVDACRNPKSNIRLASHGACKTNKPGNCPAILPCRGCAGRKKYDLCRKDSDCSGRQKCCRQALGKRCKNPCPLRKCRACPAGYKYGLDRHGCRGCNCVCATKPVQCFANPCLGASCSRYPYAKCVPNYCGGCKYDFFVGSRKVNCGSSGTKGK